jgi:hypothetical protein
VSKQPAFYPPFEKRSFGLLLLVSVFGLLASYADLSWGQEPLRGVPWEGQTSPSEPSSYLQGRPTSAPWWGGLNEFEPTERGPLFIVGPFRGNLTAGLGLYYTDNVGLTNTGSQDQLRLFENLILGVHWPISGENVVNLNFGLGLSEVLAGSRSGDTLSLTLAPDSALGFNFFIGDFRIRLFDRFAVFQDPTTDSSSTGVVNLNRFRNNGGIAIDWNLNKVILTLQVDDTYITQNARTAGNLSKVQQELSGVNGDRNTVRAALSASMQLNPSIFFGPQVTLTKSTVSTGRDIQSLAAGLFLRGQLTRLTSFSLEGGVNLVSQQGNHLPFVVQNQQKIPSVGYYLRAKANQRVTRFLELTPEVSHDLDYGDGINLIERTVGAVNGSFRLTKATNLNFGARYEDGKVLTGVNQGKYSLYQINAGLTRKLGPRIQGSFDYRFIQRTSGNNNVVVLINGQPVALPASTQNYTQNLFLLNVTYAF